MTCALQKDYTNGRNELPVYKVSVLLASITTFLAIGTLIFAKHPALRSIASVSVLGIFTALVITFVFYPTIFKFFYLPKTSKKGFLRLVLRLIVALYILSFLLRSVVSDSLQYRLGVGYCFSAQQAWATQALISLSRYGALL